MSSFTSLTSLLLQFFIEKKIFSFPTQAYMHLGEISRQKCLFIPTWTSSSTLTTFPYLRFVSLYSRSYSHRQELENEGHKKRSKHTCTSLRQSVEEKFYGAKINTHFSEFICITLHPKKKRDSGENEMGKGMKSLLSVMCVKEATN